MTLLHNILQLFFDLLISKDGILLYLQSTFIGVCLRWGTLILFSLVITSDSPDHWKEFMLVVAFIHAASSAVGISVVAPDLWIVLTYKTWLLLSVFGFTFYGGWLGQSLYKRWIAAAKR